MEINNEHKVKYIFIFLLIFYLIQSLVLLDKYVLPWDDEALFATTANAFAKDGKIKCDYVIGQEDGVYWQPPFYFIALGGFIRLFGFGLEQVRIFSIIISLVLLILVFRLSRHLYKSNTFSLLILVLIVFDPLFLRFSKMARMDIMTLLWILSSFYFYIRWIETNKNWRLTLTAISSLLAAATHPFGLIAITSILIHLFFIKNTLKRKLYLFSIILCPLMIGILVAVIYILQNQESAIEQIAFQFTRKGNRSLTESFLSFAARYRVLPGVLALIICSIGSSIIIIKRKLIAMPIGLMWIAFIISLILLMFNFEHFYSLYILIFSAILFSFLVHNIYGTAKKILVLLIIFWFINVISIIGYFYHVYLVGAKQETNVELLTQDILTSIPKDAVVAIEGYPNLFWTMRHREDLTIIAPLVLSESRIASFTSKIDYLIISMAFRISEDKEYFGKRKAELSELFEKSKKKLQLIKSFGRQTNYFCRAELYKIVEIE